MNVYVRLEHFSRLLLCRNWFYGAMELWITITTMWGISFNFEKGLREWRVDGVLHAHIQNMKPGRQIDFIGIEMQVKCARSFAVVHCPPDYISFGLAWIGFFRQPWRSIACKCIRYFLCLISTVLWIFDASVMLVCMYLLHLLMFWAPFMLVRSRWSLHPIFSQPFVPFAFAA